MVMEGGAVLSSLVSRQRGAPVVGGNIGVTQRAVLELPDQVATSFVDHCQSGEGEDVPGVSGACHLLQDFRRS
jgi:hypothetical protein